MKTFKKSLPMVLVAVVVFWIAILGPAAFRRIAFAAENGRHNADLKALTELSKHGTTSPLFRAVAKAVQPAVVVVKVKHKVAYQSTPGPQMDDFFKRFLGENWPGQFRFHQEIPVLAPEQHFDQFGLGSGVIVDAEKGYVTRGAALGLFF